MLREPRDVKRPGKSRGIRMRVKPGVPRPNKEKFQERNRKNEGQKTGK